MPFADIVGHRHVVDLLREAVVRGRVPQSLLFAGPAGVGKRRTAVALAQALNCPNQRQGDACGVCPTCKRIAAGRHGDVVLLDKGDDASIKIKPLRERVLDVVGYRPFEVARRVFIIDPADDLTDEAQDALLKTLEEPPASVVLVLVTAYPDTLRQTIQSRCRRVRFGPLSEGDVARVLTSRLEGPLPPAEAARLGAVSGGSVERALALAGGSAADLERDREAALNLVLAAARDGGVALRLKASAALVQHKSKRRDREALSARLAIVGTLLRDLGVLQVQAGSAAPLANADFGDELREIAGRFDLDRVTAAYAAVARGQASLEGNASAKLVADWVSVQL